MTDAYLVAGMIRALGRCIWFDRTNPGFGPRDCARMETDLCLKIMALEADHG